MARYDVVIRQEYDPQSVANEMNTMLFENATVTNKRPEGWDNGDGTYDDRGTVVEVDANAPLLPGQERYLNHQPHVFYYYNGE